MMAKRPLVLDINPALLVWARTSLGITVSRAAGRAKVSSRRLRDWESGKERILLPALERLATVYRRPLATFFLPEPPVELPLPIDFRTSPHASGKRSTNRNKAQDKGRPVDGVAETIEISLDSEMCKSIRRAGNDARKGRIHRRKPV